MITSKKYGAMKGQLLETISSCTAHADREENRRGNDFKRLDLYISSDLERQTDDSANDDISRPFFPKLRIRHEN